MTEHSVSTRKLLSHSSQRTSMIPARMTGTQGSFIHAIYFNLHFLCPHSAYLFIHIFIILPNVVAQRIALDVFSGVCLFLCVCVCLFVNTINESTQDDETQGVGVLYKNLGRVRISGSQLPGCAPPKMWRWATTLGNHLVCVYSTFSANYQFLYLENSPVFYSCLISRLWLFDVCHDFCSTYYLVLSTGVSE